MVPYIVADQYHVIELRPNDVTAEVYYGYAIENLPRPAMNPMGNLGKLLHHSSWGYNKITSMILCSGEGNDVIRTSLEKNRSSNNIEIGFDDQEFMTIARGSRAVILMTETFCNPLDENHCSAPCYQCFR